MCCSWHEILAVLAVAVVNMMTAYYQSKRKDK